MSDPPTFHHKIYIPCCEMLQRALHKPFPHVGHPSVIQHLNVMMLGYSFKLLLQC